MDASLPELGIKNISDSVEHPSHYTQGPPCPNCGSVIECITITERMDFMLGNAIKYIWRSGLKGTPIQDLKKARWYLDREIARREGESLGSCLSRGDDMQAPSMPEVK
jgi:hypothetical protein